MKVIQKVLTLESVDYYVKHLSLINQVLPVQLSPKEVDVLAGFMSADKKLIEEDMFNSVVRKQVMSMLSISPGGLGNYLKSMITKGLLERSEITKRIKVKPFLLPEETIQGYQFKLIKKDAKES